MVRCKLEKHVKMERCFKCWSYNHRARDCDGPDRSGRCYACRQEENSAKICKNEEFCIVCNKNGHKAGSGKCIVFRRSLLQAKKKIYYIKR
ncbi:hypothetical protein RN001_003452 [Aquatica leii]|uniref:CCHC-type domain-containing protein n=1 Tax=Aquatica leii TaxID=1421715 RepID=A0AAN7PR54_9COLE|nr:hypothetical protein RN001_003452 [Aquatica leii]